MYCLGSRDFEVAQTALRNLPEYVLLCPGQFCLPTRLPTPCSGPMQGPRGSPACLPTEHAAVLLHRAFLVGMYGQVDTSSHISEALRVLHMETVM